MFKACVFNNVVFSKLKGVYLGLTVMMTQCSLVYSMEVHDSVNISYQVKELAQMAEQASQLKQQMDQAYKHYQALTGTRKLGMILHDSDLRKMLPQDAAAIYKNGVETANIVERIVGEEKYTGSIKDMQKHISTRAKYQAAVDKAVGMRAYEGTKRRLQQIDKLMAEINKTDDPKSISELQARISIEQAMIQNEITKLQLVSQLQQAEHQLITNQRQAMSHRILNPKNTGMPTLTKEPLQ